MQPKAPHALCEQCPLNDRPFVPSQRLEGNFLAIVGEAPGREEAEQGKPFVGMSGKVLKACLEQADVPVAFITNAVLCHPLNNETPNKQAIACCRPRLIAELKEANTEVVLATGAVACDALELGVKAITKERGSAKHSALLGRSVVPTLHPAYTLRNPNALPTLAADIANLKHEARKVVTSYMLVDNQEAFDQLLTYYSVYNTHVVFDFETTGLNPLTCKVLCLAVRMFEGTSIITGEVYYNNLEGIRKLFNSQRTFVAHNAKYDLQVLEATAGVVPALCDDTMLMHYAIDERPGTHGLKTLGRDLLGFEEWDAALDAYKPSKRRKVEGPVAVRPNEEGFAAVPVEELYPYAAGDVYVTEALWLYLNKRVGKVYRDTLLPTANLLRDVEYNGFKVDEPLLYSTIDDYLVEQAELKRTMCNLAENALFNPASTQQLTEVLYNKLEFETVSSTPGGKPSTSAEVLEELQRRHPDNAFLNALVDFRHVSKALGTYLQPFTQQLRNGRLHPNFLLHGTVTGRLSGGVWLTWPRESGNKYARMLRSLVIADDGMALLAADFSQAELRVVACEAQEENYRRMFVAKEDPHSATADLLFGPSWRDKPDKKEWRTLAKTINFAVLYGAGPARIAAQANVSDTLARQVYDNYFRNFPAIKRWIRLQHKLLKEQGYLETVFGRRRHFPLLTDETLRDAEREGPNFIIQSIANDLNFHAALRISRSAQALLLMHDSVLCQVKERDAEWTKGHIDETMRLVPQQLYSDYVPFEGEVGIGRSWATCK